MYTNDLINIRNNVLEQFNLNSNSIPENIFHDYIRYIDDHIKEARIRESYENPNEVYYKIEKMIENNPDNILNMMNIKDIEQYLRKKKLEEIKKPIK